MVLEDVFSKECIFIELESVEKDELFEEMVEALHSVRAIFNRDEAVAALNAREEKMSTGIMHNVAVPHGVLSSLDGVVGAVGISSKGIDYDSLDKAPVRLVFMLLAGQNEMEKHIQILKSLAVILQKEGFIGKLCACKTQTEAYNLIVQSQELN